MRAPRLGVRPTPLTFQRGMKVGLYGGSFDPAHYGHVHVALTALIRLGLDQVVWLVSPRNPLKTEGAGSHARRIMGAAALTTGPRMRVTGIEARLRGRGPRYTVDTVRAFKARFPGVHFVWIMGADNLAGFHRWKGWAALMAEVPVAVISRPGFSVKSLLAKAPRRFAHARLPASAARGLALATPPAWVYLAAPFQWVSSSALRNAADPGDVRW